LLVPAAGVALCVATAVAVGGAVLTAVAAGRASAVGAERRAELAVATTALLDGLPDLVAYGAVDLGEVERRDGRLRRAESRAARAAGAGAAVVVATTGLAACAALVLAVDAVRAGHLDGTFLAVVALVPLALTDVLATLPDAVHEGRRGLASLRRVRALLAEPVDDASPSRDRPRAPFDLVVDGVSARWPGGEVVLHDVDVVVPAAGRVAVVGPSGSGKSTLANVVLGQLRPDAGQVRVGGLVVGPDTVEAVRATVGYCARAAYVFDPTVAENVRLARPDATDAEAEAALRDAKLGDW